MDVRHLVGGGDGGRVMAYRRSGEGRPAALIVEYKAGPHPQYWSIPGNSSYEGAELRSSEQAKELVQAAGALKVGVLLVLAGLALIQS